VKSQINALLATLPNANSRGYEEVTEIFVSRGVLNFVGQ
jgi:hypothetical protein